ncbi:tannase/feruloyl esterase family alpha/beta hydrolase [Phytoactinopolyspora limicola]|uniref:tannase/feruloyl esterase family alpha/beta hydrolase n=1 Tax=Phytoactinopolyspora limicola TaxID=2715536 RepID=UPI00140B1186|nr:tannase/feruloyl esterase family alpha/beta hydrolase [Phytoactinopolyspora limicola]
MSHRTPRRGSWIAAGTVVCVALVSCAGDAGDDDVGEAPLGKELSSEDAGEQCDALVGYVADSVTVESTTLVAEADGVGEHCLVEAVIRTPGDDTVDGNDVGFHVGLPSTWTGDFFFQGVGGFAGEVGSLDAGLVRGHAAASTDTGHRASSVDGSWALHNYPAQLDWAHRGTHVATLASKAIVEEYYASTPRYSYFEGCSNGGRQGLMAAQRYPDDFDGIVVHAPGISLVAMVASWVWQIQAQLRTEGAWLPPEDIAALDAATLEAAYAADAAVADLVVAPDRIDGGVAATLVEADILTAEQAAAVTAIHGGWPDRSDLVPGHPIGHESTWPAYLTGMVAPVPGDNGLTFPAAEGIPVGWILASEILRYFVFDDPEYDLASFDLDTDLSHLSELASLLDADDPDLSEFQDRGGRLLMTHGLADPAINAQHTIGYYEQVHETMGSDIADLARLYLVPGMDHCRGGAGLTHFDALDAMEKWVHDGTAPDELRATDETAERQAPLCPYPAQIVAKENGDDLWSCE